MMMTGVPNMAWVMGYFRASWTLRVDMLGDFVCNLLNHMDAKGVSRVDVALRDEDQGMELLPWIESDNFNPGYLVRGLDQMPRRGGQARMAAQSGLLGRKGRDSEDRSGRQRVRL